MKKNRLGTFLLFICLAPLTVLAKDRVLIPAGTFKMGCSLGDDSCENDEGVVGGVEVHVDHFSIDINEVTVEQYAQCIKKGKCKRPNDHKRNKYCNLGAVDRTHHPINCIDWQQAVDYCQWKGGRLPLEAEWEKAARAGSSSAFPWGASVSCKQAIVDDGKTSGSVPGEPDGCGEDRTWPIGSRQPNEFGLLDMHGNVGEWTANWYAKNAIKSLYSKGHLAGPEKGRQKVVRGGSWDENVTNLRSSYRNTKRPVSGDSIYGSIGFRCVYDAL